MKYELRPKNILVLGGGSGIGYATAQCLLESGAKNVILASRSEEKLKKAKEMLKVDTGQAVWTIDFDISDVSGHMKKILCINNMIGDVIDGVVISSGVDYDGKNWKGFNISEEDWDRVMNTNLKGVFFLIRNYSNYFYENGIKGNICVVSSISAHRDMLSVYQVSKSAISGIVHAYGKHLCERGVVLNCVEPGTTNTDMMSWCKEFTDGIRPGKPWTDNSIRRLIRPEEIAEVIVYLMTDIGEVMSGSCVLAGGGCKGLAR